MLFKTKKNELAMFLLAGRDYCVMPFFALKFPRIKPCNNLYISKLFILSLRQTSRASIYRFRARIQRKKILLLSLFGEGLSVYRILSGTIPPSSFRRGEGVVCIGGLRNLLCPGTAGIFLCFTL